MSIIFRCVSCLSALFLMLAAGDAYAVNLLIDTFDQGPQHVQSLSVENDIYSGPGPLGGERQLYAHNAHTTPNAVIDVNGGGSAPAGELLSTGSGAAARAVGWGSSNIDGNNWSANAQLNLNLPDTQTIEIDVEEVIEATADTHELIVVANGGAKVFRYNLYTLDTNMQANTAVPFTTSIDLNAPTGGSAFVAGDLADVDAVRLRWYNAASLRISEIRFGGTAVPEPSTLALAGFGLLGLAGYVMRRRRR